MNELLKQKNKDLCHCQIASFFETRKTVFPKRNQKGKEALSRALQEDYTRPYLKTIIASKVTKFYLKLDTSQP